MANIAKLLGGTTALESMVEKMDNKEKVTLKIGNYNIGQIEKVINILTPELFESLIEGNFKTTSSADCMNFRVELMKFVDNSGRVIPFNLSADVRDADTNYAFKPHHLLTVEDCEKRLERLRAAGFDCMLSAEIFWRRCMHLMEEVSSKAILSNLLKGVWVPVLLPIMNITDIGTTTDDLLVKLATAFDLEFDKDNSMTNPFIVHQRFAQRLEIKHPRYQRFCRRLKSWPVVGLYFLTPFQGFSPNAELAAIDKFRKEYVPAGPIEGIISRIMYPDLLFKEKNTLNSNFSSVWDMQCPGPILSLRQHDHSFIFKAGEYNNHAHANSSGGILYVGKQNQ